MLFKSLYGRLRTALRLRLDARERELVRIAALPRFTPGKTALFGPSIEFIDSASFVAMYREIIQRGIYSFSTTNREPLIIDAGANIGISVIELKTRFPGAKIFGIEADPGIFRVLQSNVNTLGLEGVELFQAALWDERTELEFSSQGADAGRVGVLGKHANSVTIRVSTLLLSEILQAPVDFLKIDIEGAELRVLEEAKDWLRNVERIFVEYHSFSDSPQDLAEVLVLLRSAGFRVHIQNVGSPSKPFLTQWSIRIMDMQLNIYGYRA